jgi:lysozyme
MAEKTLGIDCSQWQDEDSTPQMMDFTKAIQNGARFEFTKVSQATWLDEDFIMNWHNARLAGILRGGYHFLDWTKPALEQARFCAGALANDPGELPLVMDYECRTGAPAPAVARREALTFLVEVEQLLGRKPILYTSPGYWFDFGSHDPYWKQFDLWIAHYEVTRPAVPAPWTEWRFWQYTCRGPGLLMGAESRYIDMDWFNGDYQALMAYAGNPVIDPPPQPVAPAAIGRVRVTASTLNLRAGPSTTFSDVGDTTCDTDWYAFEEIGPWVRIGQNVWIKFGPGLAEWIERY